jgi:colanic acid biosynthesis glycosyl transferase WcaI
VRVAILSINYDPEPVGIAVYTTGLAEYLASHGHTVRVHTTFPWYPAWRKRAGDRGRIWTTERRKGVSVWRAWHHVPRRPGALGRMLHEASHVLTALVSWVMAPAADLVIVVMPPLLLGLPVALACRLRGTRVLVHVQDLQPDTAIALGLLRPSWFTRLLLVLERLTYRLADRVSSIGDAMLERIGQKGVGPARRLLLRNWATVPLAGDAVVRVDEGQAGGGFRQRWGLQEAFVVLYAGNLGLKQGVELLVDAAEVLRGESSIAFVVVGDGNAREALEEAIRARDLPNMVVYPLVAADELPALIDMADVAVIPQRLVVSDRVLPSKLANLLARARPVIVAAPAGSELERLVSEAPAGLVVSPGDAMALASAIGQLHRDPARCARLGAGALATAARHFDPETVLARFVDELQAMVSSPDRPTSPDGGVRVREPSGR